MVFNTIYHLDRINQKGFKQIHKIYMGICMFFIGANALDI